MKFPRVISLHWAPSVVLASVVVAGTLWFISGSANIDRLHAAAPAKKLDPAAWGEDHVGQEVPQYMESGECLFCHREQVGGTWQTNKHARTVRDATATEPAIQALSADAKTKALAGDVKLLMGDTRAQRFIKRSADYGKVDLLSVVATFGRGQRARLSNTDKPAWDAETFATSCAGCHATGVSQSAHTFAAVSIDCYSCHGPAIEDHSGDAKLILLAKARKDPPEVVTSICASCHLRNGKSKATGLPYPANFVAGDNLFRDFQVDFAAADDPKLNPGDAHVLANVRDVVVNGEQSVTCLNCHDVHTGSSKKHRDVAVTKFCQHCHDAASPIKGHKTYEVHSERCQY